MHCSLGLNVTVAVLMPFYSSLLSVIFPVGSGVKGWLGRRVVSVLDSSAQGPAWVRIAAATLLGNSLRQTVDTHRASVH